MFSMSLTDVVDDARASRTRRTARADMESNDGSTCLPSPPPLLPLLPPHAPSKTQKKVSNGFVTYYILLTMLYSL